MSYADRRKASLYVFQFLLLFFLALFGINTDMVFYLEARLYINRMIRDQEILNPHRC